MLSISSGHSAKYLTDAVATGRENYYTGAVAEGEPPGRWYGAGAEALGLSGFVDHQDMEAVYERFLDPRDPNFRNKDRWAEVATLGHTGRKYLTEEQIYEAALQAEPNADAERRAELRVQAGKKARSNVAFHDATFSVPKSVTVLHTAFEAQEVQARRTAEQAAADGAAARTAGDVAAARRCAYRYTQARTAEQSWGEYRQAVEDAIWAGNNAGLDYLADKAGHSRVGHHGGAAGRYTDAHDWTIASFFQHDSRNHDPQLHIHNAILNRVLCPDGKWRTLDGESLYRHRGAAGAVAERTMFERLAAVLGVASAMRPDGKSREIVGIAPAVMDLFSSRRRAITSKTATLVDAFIAQFGREPNGLELDRLQRRATLATRRAKSHAGETREEFLARCERELRAEVAGGLEQVARDVLDLTGQTPPVEQWSPGDVIETALADLQAKKAAWTAADLTRAISDALPDRLGNLDGRQVAELLDGLTAEALTLVVPLDADRPGDAVLPDELRLANGQSAYDKPGGRLYATPDHIHTERLLAAADRPVDAARVSDEHAHAFVHALAEAGVELGVDQAAAVRGVLTSGARVESLVGPAGTGKSFVVGALARAWSDPDLWTVGETADADAAAKTAVPAARPRRAVGLASSQIATDVLTGEGLDAINVTRWLNTQQALAAGSTDPNHQRWRIEPGDLVVLDESSMTATADLARIHQYVTAAGAKLLLTGDHKQLAAVGAGGGMELALDAGPVYELAEVRRFTHAWEGPASLRLRVGDERVLDDYHRAGRLIDGGTIEQAEASAIRAYLADTLAGKRSVLVVDSNDQAERISAQIRAQLVHLGRVCETGVRLGRDGNTAGIGDIVQARRNGWRLDRTVDGERQHAPINRRQYQVLDVRDDGGLRVAPILGSGPDGRELGGHVDLPAWYVAEHLTLGYACTVHAVEGMTVDTSHAVVTPHTRPEALYVGLSRGRDTNTAHTVTQAAPAPDAPTGETHTALHRSSRSVIAGVLDTDVDHQPGDSALATAATSAGHAESVRTHAELFADGVEQATAGRTARWLDELTAAGVLTAEHRLALAADDIGSSGLDRTLRRAELAGHDPRAVLADAVTSRSLDGARHLTTVLHDRITARVPLDPIGDRYADWIPADITPEWRAYLTSLADDADTRGRTLADQIAADPPQWAVESLGPVPDEPDQRAQWTSHAAVVASHRERAGVDDPAEPLGPPPKSGQPEAYASWRAAWRALGRPEADRAEVEMSDGQLRVRIRAYEREQTWAPRYVANELAGTIQTAEQHRRTAALRQAEADSTEDAERAEQLRREAEEAAALADTLDTQVEQLRQVDEARAHWLAHTAGTRAAADRAKAELSARRAGDGHDEPTVTAEEWLEAHRAEQAEADLVRPIVDEHDFADVVAQRAADQAAAEPAPSADAAETAVPDLRQVAEDESDAHRNEDQVRVPTADETAAAVARAHRALAEMEDRDEADQQRQAEEDERAAQLARWHANDHAVDQATVAETDDDSPVLDRAGGGR